MPKSEDSRLTFPYIDIIPDHGRNSGKAIYVLNESINDLTRKRVHDVLHDQKKWLRTTETKISDHKQGSEVYDVHRKQKFQLCMSL